MDALAARQAIAAGFGLRGIPPIPAALQLVQAISAGETGGAYGGSFGGSNNFGSVQCPHLPPCPPGCIERPDSDPAKGPYQACFRLYATAALGAADFVRELYRRAGFAQAASSGDALGAARAMYRTGYFAGQSTDPETAIRAYATGIARNAKIIAGQLGEPLRVTLGGGGGAFGTSNGDDAHPVAKAAAVVVLGVALYKAVRASRS